MGYRVDISGALKGMSEAKLKTMHAIEVYGRSAAMKLAQEAKDSAPWRDRTGLARQTITPVSEWNGNKYRIGVSGNMNYSVYLELAREKRYAVLWPVVLKRQAEVCQGMRGLLK